MIGLFKLIGALGILLISIGILTKNRITQDIFYILGGICLLIYSFYIHDIIFIILQMIFTAVAVYDLVKQKIKKNN